ncbi:MAG: hypothetical protein HQ538_05590 [Parcubacteria group bacterium]|nr:hypothetical protein [Parcubacteria group bacterium]
MISNRVIDLIVGLSGFLFMYFLMRFNIFDFKILFMGTFILLATLDIWGYLAYGKRKQKK